ncbi:hypothetical protein [Amycolatopsis sp. NPDC051128]|uniref:hypothetical protein n=1 Tax=Amycolatopsis sp. NPDC051128 TaxID=3155412 RepID=UPI0034453CE1
MPLAEPQRVRQPHDELGVARRNLAGFDDFAAVQHVRGDVRHRVAAWLGRHAERQDQLVELVDLRDDPALLLQVGRVAVKPQHRLHRLDVPAGERMRVAAARGCAEQLVEPSEREIDPAARGARVAVQDAGQPRDPPVEELPRGLLVQAQRRQRGQPQVRRQPPAQLGEPQHQLVPGRGGLVGVGDFARRTQAGADPLVEVGRVEPTAAAQFVQFAHEREGVLRRHPTPSRRRDASVERAVHVTSGSSAADMTDSGHRNSRNARPADPPRAGRPGPHRGSARPEDQCPDQVALHHTPPHRCTQAEAEKGAEPCNVGAAGSATFPVAARNPTTPPTTNATKTDFTRVKILQ